GLKTEVLHPVQAAMAENGSSQCGFCTPGIVISLAGLAASTAHPDDHEIHDALAGNLCRCTGYRPIVEAARKVAGAGGAPI
ncbi:2Fe-2S iron-sulfur cluster-binding protein, partial [Escherichia coli]|uniref:2Fe-2S iron-sulfur cluster-binding protein n=2 Tax=Pseudomonadota TaxID=1224 RepID=UPI00207D044E